METRWMLYLEEGQTLKLLSGIPRKWLENDKQIDNKKRALDAVEKIYKTLKSYTAVGPEWKVVEPDYTNIVNAPDYNSRIKMISDFIHNKVNETVTPYDSNTWIDAALKQKDFSVEGTFEFINESTLRDTHWYKFNQAAKEQLSIVLDLIKGL